MIDELSSKKSLENEKVTPLDIKQLLSAENSQKSSEPDSNKIGFFAALEERYFT